MRLIVAVFVVCAAITRANAQECREGSPSPISIHRWSAEQKPGTTVVRVVIKNDTAKVVVMIDSTAHFRDALGADIGSIVLTRDVLMPPRLTDYDDYQTTLARLSKLDHQNVVVNVCTRAVLYQDGLEERF